MTAFAPVATDPLHRGVKILHDPVRNRGTAFTEAQRDELGLRGLLPPRVHTVEEQVMRIRENLARKPNDLERYLDLVALQDRNETLFYHVVVEHLAEMMPIIYTPTVGQACELYGHIYRRPRGMFISADDRGSIADILHNWPHEDVRIVVVTDGERILGLGDLGADGMGIPVGKLSLYTACAGIPPTQCLPITLDVGTNSEVRLNDPLYIGLRQNRMRGAAYDAFIEEFLEAVTTVFPKAVIQLEDFGNRNAFRLLETYRDRYCLFDDDIQGTAAVTLAGLWSAMRITGGELADQRILFFGAGEAGIGIGELVTTALVEGGMDEREARSRSWYFDTHGLVVASRTGLAEYKKPFAHAHAGTDDLLAAVNMLRPTAIIGVSGVPRAFTRPVVEAMASINRRPIVFALSNPTSKSECTARQAYQWTDGRAVFASGSPFAPIDIGGRTFIPGQGNNAYVFPGIGLGAIVSATRRITGDMFVAAARSLADQVSPHDLELGRVYPALARIRSVSAHIAAAVAEKAYEQGLAGHRRPHDLLESIEASMYQPEYEDEIMP